MTDTATPPKSKAKTLRRSLIITFVSVSLLSVLLLGVLNYYEARGLLTDSVKDQLLNQQTAKSLAIRSGLDRLEQVVIVTAQSPYLVESVTEFSDAYASVTGPGLLDAEQQADLDAMYRATIDGLGALGTDAIDPETLQPGSAVGEFLHYHYIASNDHEPLSDLTTAPGDDSDYGAVHTARHPALVGLRTQLGFGDLLLVDTEGNIVYTTNKRLDFATNAKTGPYRNSGMGEAVAGRIAAAPVGDAVFVDFELYLPAAGKPSLFVASAIRDEARTVGALLIEIPIDSLNSLTIGEGNWEETGFGETAEVYVVGRDRLMRTDSRLWIEDPGEYLIRFEKEGFDPSVGRLIETFGSTVLLQSVETTAVLEALDGEQFDGRSDNYLGTSSLTVSGPVGADQVDWVVVAEISTKEANTPLREYAVRVLIAGLILIPVVILLAMVFADRMTKAVRPVVKAAAAVAEGDLDTRLPDLGRNEFGDVARRLNLLTATLSAKEDALEEEEREIKHLLLSALPDRLVTALRSGKSGLLDLVDTATVIAFDVDGVVNGTGIDEEEGVELATELSQRIETVAEGTGVERVRSSTGEHIFTSGLDSPDIAAGIAADFALQVVDAINDFEQSHGIEVTFRAGMSGGSVIAGLLAAEHLTYGVFGDPPRTALALVGAAGDDQILIDTQTAAHLDETWILETAEGLVDLQGNTPEVLVLKGRAAEADGNESSS